MPSSLASPVPKFLYAYFFTFAGNQIVSFIIPIEGNENRFLIAQGRSLIAVTWDGISDKVTDVEKVGEVEDAPETIDNQINDAKADRTGRLWFGTLKMEPIIRGDFTERHGALYSFGPNRAIKKQCQRNFNFKWFLFQRRFEKTVLY